MGLDGQVMVQLLALMALVVQAQMVVLVVLVMRVSQHVKSSTRGGRQTSPVGWLVGWTSQLFPDPLK